MENKYGKEYFANARVGLFTHYTYATYAEDKEIFMRCIRERIAAGEYPEATFR